MRLRQPKHDAIETALLTLFVFCAVFFLVGLLFEAVAKGAEADCYRATCRIEMGDRSGSGCVFRADDERFYILTNAHVAGTRKGIAANAVFNRLGYEGTIYGRTEWGVLGPEGVPDVAVVSVARADLGGYEPPVVPLADPNQLEVGETLFSVGAPQGGWLTGWTGHVQSNNGQVFRFTPRPHHGRSGSPIFNSSGTAIVGLLTWDIETLGVGQAQTIATVRNAMQGNATVLRAADLQGGGALAPVQICPDGNCPNGSCPNGMCPMPNQQGPAARDPWPNFRRTPPAVEKTEPEQPSTPTPKGCDCDLSGLACKCDGKEVAKLAEELAKLREELAAKKAEQPENPFEPAQPAAKGCECDLSALSIAIAGVQAELAALAEKVNAKPEPIPPPDPPPSDPQPKPPKVHHHVVVADLSATGWPRVSGEVEQARDVFSAIQVVSANDVPFEVRPLPQLVTYDDTGTPIAIAKGERDVSLALQRIYRRE